MTTMLIAIIAIIIMMMMANRFVSRGDKVYREGEILVRVGFPQRNGFQFQGVIYQRSSTIAPKIYS